jgi:hypothetical protein
MTCDKERARRGQSMREGFYDSVMEAKYLLNRDPI